MRSTRRPGFKIFEALVADDTGSLRVTWLNQPFLRDVIARGQHVVLFGSAEMRGSGGLQLTNPQYEIIDDPDGETIHTGRIVPIYEKTGAVTPKIQRRLVFEALQRLPDDLPEQLPESMCKHFDSLAPGGRYVPAICSWDEGLRRRLRSLALGATRHGAPQHFPSVAHIVSGWRGC